MSRTTVLIGLAVLAHIAWVATYESGAGDLMGFVFLVLVVAAAFPYVRRGWRKLRVSRKS